MAAALVVTSLPEDAAVSTTVAKSHLRVDHTADDTLIGRIVAAATVDAGVECGRSFGVAGFLYTLDEFPLNGEAIQLPVRPIVAVTSLEYIDEDGNDAEMEPGDYWLGLLTGRIAPAAGYWPETEEHHPESVTVAFTAGHDVDSNAIPPQAVEAILMIVADRYEHRGDGDSKRRAIPEAASRLLRQLHPTGQIA